jgi:diketogulonate reductase-like aldo/keto reductase
MVYQGFSLLTANMGVLEHPVVTRVAARERATPAQAVFRFARAVGMLPLTGTSNEGHMREDLDCSRVEITAEEIAAIEGLAG